MYLLEFLNLISFISFQKLIKSHEALGTISYINYKLLIGNPTGPNFVFCPLKYKNNWQYLKNKPDGQL